MIVGERKQVNIIFHLRACGILFELN